MREKITIPAMRERDMRDFLKDHGEIECVFCGTTLTWNDIGGVFVKDGGPTVVCAATECIERARQGGTDG
ncbi:MAG: hypothetical protein NT140_08575 [Deltaproteobacteria bacterium]|nr:hypothetical protein [Deltaproteobacteria bacterium]